MTTTLPNKDRFHGFSAEIFISNELYEMPVFTSRIKEKEKKNQVKKSKAQKFMTGESEPY